MPDITGDKSAPVKKQFNPRPQESAKAMISVVFVGYRSPFKRATPGDMLSDGLAPNILLSRLRTLNRGLFNATNTGGKYYFFEKVLDKCVIIIYVQMNIIYYA